MPLANSRQISVCSESPDTVQHRYFIFRPSPNQTNSIISMVTHAHTTAASVKSTASRGVFYYDWFYLLSCKWWKKRHHNIIIYNKMRLEDRAFHLNAFLVSPFKWEKTSSYNDTQSKSLMGYLKQNNVTHLDQRPLRGYGVKRHRVNALKDEI